MSDISQAEKSTALTVVDITVTIPYADALWLVENAYLQGGTPHNLAASILLTVIREDRLAHGEPEQVTVQ